MSEIWIGEGVPTLVKSGRNAGKWRLQWTVLPGGARGDRVRIDRLFPTRREALAWREEAKRQLGAGTFGGGKAQGPTLADWWLRLAGTRAEEYRDGVWVRDGARRQTVGTKAARWSRWVAGTRLALTPLSLIDREAARRHVEAMRSGGASVGTRSDTFGMLAKLYDDAMRESGGDTTRNPFRRLPLTDAEERDESEALRVAAGTRATSLLEPAALRAALARLERPEARALLALPLLAGLRRSEIMALAIEQLDPARGVLVIDRAVKLPIAGPQYIGLPKGDKTRLVAVCPTLGRILAECADDLRAGSSGPGNSGLLFPNGAGEPLTKKTLYARWHRAGMDAGIPGLTLQEARQAHNNWIEKLMPKVSLSTRLEHMGHQLASAGSGPRGIVVNLRNYTGHLPDGYETLRREIERAVCREPRGRKDG